MAAQRVSLYGQQAVTLATTLTQLIFGDDVGYIEFSCAADCYLVWSDSKADGDAVGASFTRIPANCVYQIPRTGIRALVAASTGTPGATLTGFPA